MIPAWLSFKDGVYLNDLKRYVKGGFLAPEPSQIPVVIPAAAALTLPNASAPVVAETGSDANMEIFSLMGSHDAAVPADVQQRMSMFITDIAFRRRLSNRDVLVNHVFGSGLAPFFLRESLFLEMQQSLTFNFFNNSTAGATSFEFSGEHRKFQATSFSRDNVSKYIDVMRQRKQFLYPYWLTSDQPITIPAGGTLNTFFTATRDVWLVLMGSIGSFISAGVAGDIVEGFEAQIFDAKTSRPLQNQPVIRSCGFGTASFPFIFPTAWVIEPNTKIQITFRNLITDAPIDIFTTFFGVALYAARNIEAAQVAYAMSSQYSRGS